MPCYASKPSWKDPLAIRYCLTKEIDQYFRNVIDETRVQIIWFLAPTVALCSQQFDVIRLQAAAASMKLLTGKDNVDTWSASIWDIILRDVRIVVSTYQVLLDALCHSFVKMDRISLIVFDEGL